MTNEKCKTFFKVACKTAGVSQKDAIKAVWGKFTNREYWISESKTISGHCVWCARANAVLEVNVPALKSEASIKTKTKKS